MNEERLPVNSQLTKNKVIIHSDNSLDVDINQNEVLNTTLKPLVKPLEVLC